MKSVGIHVDARKVRILELDISPKRTSLLNLFEMDRAGSESVSEILRGYFSRASSPDRVVASVGEVPAVIRNFSFPFRDRSRVQQAILAEFEDSLPVEIDNYVLEFQPTGRADNLYTFLGALVPREPLEDMNRVFETINVLPSDFLIPSEALGRLGLALLSREFAPGSVVCICDIGFEVTQIAVVHFPRQGKKFKPSDFTSSVIEFRHINRGTKDLYDREGNKLALTVKEFEDWLATKVSFANGSTGLDDLKNAIRPLLVELYQVSQASLSKTGQKVESFVITGGFSQSVGFRDFFEHELRTQTLIWDPFQNIDSSRVNVGAETFSRFVVPLALALRHGSLKSLSWLNFRRSSKRKQIISAALDRMAQPEFKTVALPFMFLSAAVFIICLAASFLMDARISRQADRAKTALARAKTPFGSKVETLLTNPEEVQDQFATYKKRKLGELPANGSSAALIDDLLKISQALPPNVRVDELKLNNLKSGKDLQASLNSENNPSVTKEALQTAIKGRGYNGVSVTNQGRNFIVKAKGL